MCKRWIHGALSVALLGAFFLCTPQAEAQRRGGRVSVGPVDVRWGNGPRYGYYNYGWYGRPNWYSGYGAPYRYGYSYYPYRSYYYRDYYPRPYYYSAYPEAYVTYPATTTYQSYYPPVQTTSSTARISVRVPDPNADVWFNGVATQQRGMDRLFETPALSGGYRHTYEIRARWVDADGRMIDRTRTIDVQAGQDLVVDFG